MNDWFKARNIWGAAILTLSDAEAGRLAKAIWGYTMSGEEQNLSGAEKGLFAMIQMQLDQDAQRDADISEKRASAGAAGGKQTQANASKEKAEEANQANASNKNKNQNKKENKNQNKEHEETRAREEKTPPGFDRFWESYPRKTAKQEAIKAFEKLKPDAMLIETMVKAIERQKQSAQWQEDGGRYIPHPATWINQRRWEDVLPAKGPEKLKVVNAAKYDQREYHESDFEENDQALLREAAMM
jgi:hypothetical protein